MKKLLALILAFAMMLGLFGCSAGTQKPAGTSAEPEQSDGTAEEEQSTEAPKGEMSSQELTQLIYQALNALAEGTDLAGSDICQAWYLAIHNEEDVVKGGAGYLAEHLTMSEDELREGVAHMAFSETGGDWDAITDEQWKELRNKDSLFAEAQKKDSLFDLCINVVWAGLLEINFYDDMEENLHRTKEAIRQLQEKDAENKYLEPLKEYYGVIRAYFEWCSNPDGNYNEAKELMDTYQKDYRNYRDMLEFDLGE